MTLNDFGQLWFIWFTLSWHLVMPWTASSSDLTNRSGPKCHQYMGQMRVSGTILTPGKLLCQNTHCGKGPLMASNLKERSSVVLDHCYPLPHLTYLKLGEMEGVAVCERLLSFKMNAVCFKMLKEARGGEKEGDGNLVIVATHNSPADCPGWKFLCFVTNVMLRKPKQLGSKPLLTQGVKKLHTTKMVPSC